MSVININNINEFTKINLFIENELFNDLIKECEEKGISINDMIDDAITLYRLTQFEKLSYEIALQNIDLKYLQMASPAKAGDYSP